MDFNNNDRRSQSAGSPSANSPVGIAPTKAKRAGRSGFSPFGSKSMRFVSSVLFVSSIVLISAVLLYVAFGPSKKTADANLVKTNQMQAVFLNGGQVYFGQITDLNNDYTRLANIYYLRVEQKVQPGSEEKASDISLAKLGCELHGPEDAMVINRDQIIFWENLKDDGQVAKAVENYIKANPNGQVCTTPSASTPTDTPAAITP